MPGRELKGVWGSDRKTKNWQYQAAINIKCVFGFELEFQRVEEIAERLVRAFDNVTDYNETVRNCPDLQPEEKLWIVVP